MNIKEIKLDELNSTCNYDYLMITTLIGDIIGSDTWTSNELFTIDNMDNIRLWNNENKDWKYIMVDMIDKIYIIDKDI